MSCILRLFAFVGLLVVAASPLVTANHHHEKHRSHETDKQLVSASLSAAAAVSRFDDYPLRFSKPKIADDSQITNATKAEDDWNIIFSNMLPCRLDDMYSSSNFVVVSDGECHNFTGMAYGRVFASYMATIQPHGYNVATVSLFGGGACELQTLVQVYALLDNTWSIADLRTQEGYKYSVMCYCQGEQGPFGKFCQHSKTMRN